MGDSLRKIEIVALENALYNLRKADSEVFLKILDSQWLRNQALSSVITNSSFTLQITSFTVIALLFVLGLGMPSIVAYLSMAQINVGLNLSTLIQFS